MKANSNVVYFNTTGSKGQLLSDYQQKALTQNQAIYRYIKRQNRSVGPSEVWKNLFNERIPITSVRRAFNTLTRYNLLEKLESKQEGAYGRLEHKWRVRVNA